MDFCVRRRVVIAGIAGSALVTMEGTTHHALAGEPETLRIGGTGMALATMRLISEGFVATRPEMTLKVLPSLGTGGGIAAVSGAAIDLALSARELTDAERGKGLQSFAYGRTPIAFVTHPGTAIGDITLSDVVRILAGSLLAWPDGTRIRLVRREPSDADWTMLRTLSPDMVTAVSIALGRPGLLTVATDQENADALERLPGSFGAMSIGQVRAENRHVAPLRLDGHPPEVTELAAGHYPLSRTLYVIWRERPRPEVEQFLAFLRSEQTGQILIRLGHIPLLG